MTEAPDETVEKAEEPRPRESAASMPFPLPESLRPYGGVVKRVWAVVPWASFVLGAFGAYVMDRGPDQSWLIALGAIGTWITVLGLRFVSRYERPSLVGRPKTIAVVARISLILATQGLMQLTLFFALPFFFYASLKALDIGHGVFLLLLTGMSVVSLWDPLTEKLLKRPLLASALPAFGSFAALTAVLPALGLSTQVSLWLAVLSAVIGFPVITAASVEPGQRLKWVSLSCALALLFPVLMYLGATRIVPAAPLRLVDAAIGTELVGRWVKEPVTKLEHVPPRLHCATAIASPLGLRDQLFHVWRKDGRERSRIKLTIVGGRKQGWRTHSRITPGLPGKYTCTVETANGQSLGSRSVKITAR
jgi:hypothetical protein